MTAAVASSTVLTGFGNTTGNLSPPSGMGTGDLDVLAVVIATGSGSTFATPAGYTELFQDAITTSEVGRIVAFLRAAEASPANVAVTWNSYGRYFTASRHRISGADVADPINVIGALAQGAAAPNTDPTMALTAATTDEDDCLALSIFGWAMSALDGTSPWFTASGWTTTGWNDATHAHSLRPSGCALSKVIATAGTTGSCVIDPSAGTYADPHSWGGRIIAFNSSGGGGGGALIRPRATWIM